MKKPRVFTVLSVMFVAFCVHASFGQISIAQLGVPITEDFNTLPQTGNNLPVSNNISPLNGWYFTRMLLSAGTGSSSGATVWSFGRNPVPGERALGSMTRAGLPEIHFAMVLRNDTGFALRSFVVQFTGEQWRMEDEPQQHLDFSYQTIPSLDALDLTAGSFIPVPDLTFYGPKFNIDNSSLPGNAPENRRQLIAAFSVDVPPNEFIVLRWSRIYSGDTSHGLAIDDLSVIPRAAPTAASVAIAGRVAAGDGVGIKGVTVIVEGGGIQRRVSTGSFGNFRVEGLTAGETYVVSVASRKFSFPEPARIVTLNNDVTKMEFVAFLSSVRGRGRF